jgi:hypothetical protein
LELYLLLLYTLLLCFFSLYFDEETYTRQIKENIQTFAITEYKSGITDDLSDALEKFLVDYVESNIE